MAGKLTAVKAAKARGPAILHDGGGLYLRVSKTGARSWVFRFQIGGKRRDMGSPQVGGYGRRGAACSSLVVPPLGGLRVKTA